MPNNITDFVQRSGTKLYYNPMVKLKGCEHDRTYKYGIIHEEDFIRDLLEWRDFFVSARLQKPVLEIVNNDTTGIIK